jgi:hypothetical protein
MKRKSAEYINSILLKHSSDLKDVISMAKKDSNKEEFDVFLQSTSHLIAINFDILDKIYDEYPDLKPSELD